MQLTNAHISYGEQVIHVLPDFIRHHGLEDVEDVTADISRALNAAESAFEKILGHRIELRVNHWQDDVHKEIRQALRDAGHDAPEKPWVSFIGEGAFVHYDSQIHRQ